MSIYTRLGLPQGLPWAFSAYWNSAHALPVCNFWILCSVLTRKTASASERSWQRKWQNPCGIESRSQNFGFFSQSSFSVCVRKDPSKELCHLIFPRSTNYAIVLKLLSTKIVSCLFANRKKNSGTFPGEKDFSLALNTAKHSKSENLMSKQLICKLFYISVFKQWFYTCPTYL